MTVASVAQQIRRSAARYGVDPRAALAVARVEGGLGTGAVGDQGTSFGPFQLHVGGALPRGRGAAWANSPAGIDYALRQMGSSARGLRGRAAVQSIVQNFERPANPGGEIQRALALYGSTPPGASTTSGPAMPSSNAPSASPGLALALIKYAQSGGSSVGGILQALSSRPPVPGGGLPPAPGGAAFDGEPAHGKIIGRPYQGTHTLGNWESDNAVDISVPFGTPIRAVANGTIGSQFGSLGSSNPRFAGLRLHLQTGRNEFYYAHLSRFAPGIKPGAHVTAGEVIGYSGAANGVNHLHFAVRDGNPMGVK